MQLPIKDRRSAGRELAALLDAFRDQKDVIVLGLPRGGVPVAYEIASALGVELDVLIVRKLGVPGHEELAMGAIASGGHRVMNQEIVLFHNIPREVVDDVVRRETEELNRRERDYRGNRPRPDLKGRTVLLVDDGLATGASMRAAIDAVNQQAPERIVIAVPVAASMTINRFRTVVDECVALTTPEPLFAVSQWYEDFAQTTDDEVKSLLQQYWQKPAAGAENASADDGIEVTPIKQDQWRAFLQSFAAEHKGWLVTLGEVDTEQLQEHPNEARDRMRKQVDGVPLREVLYDQNQDAVLVQVSEDKEARSVHIDHPVGVYRERVHASDKGIRIDTHAGKSTLVEFRVTASPAELDGVAVTELS